jgi:hypothetical protein
MIRIDADARKVRLAGIALCAQSRLAAGGVALIGHQ